MITIILVFIVVAVSVPLGIAAHHWLFERTTQVCDPEWEVYQQRFD